MLYLLKNPMHRRIFIFIGLSGAINEGEAFIKIIFSFRIDRLD